VTPSTIVRALKPASRGPFTFVGMSALFSERGDGAQRTARPTLPRCVAREDDGTPCGLVARYVDFKRGGHVCYEHRPDRKQEALQLV
jgi:hypothetical protein